MTKSDKKSGETETKRILIRNTAPGPLIINMSKYEGRIIKKKKIIHIVPAGVTIDEELGPGVTPVDLGDWEEAKKDASVAQRIKDRKLLELGAA